jgi:hypothetical protein
MNLPHLTPVQYTVIEVLFQGKMTASRLRQGLAERGFPQSTSVFSRVMSRLSWVCLVEAEYRQQRRGVQVWRERFYAVTDYGVMAWKATRAFYAEAEPPPNDLKAVPTEAAELAPYSPRNQKKIIFRRLAREFPKLFSQMTGG